MPRNVQPYFVLDQTARTLAVREGERVPAKPLRAMVEQIIANNRAGGWRKLKEQS